jgi:phosphatidylglycerol:prolipoprotein diacylglycerol transferase
MIVHNFDPILIDLGLFQIRWYSIAYILGIVFGWIYSIKIIKDTKKKYNLNLVKTEIFDDFIIYLIFGVIIGGRLGYVIFYDFQYYIENLSEIIKIWNGGMSFHGGLIGIITATSIFAKIKKVNFFNLTDIVACVAPMGIFLGRLANFINGELFGKVSNLPWAVIFPDGGNVPRHPSQLYEAFLEGIILFILINFLAFKKQFIIKTGQTSGLFLVFYSVLRILSESFREPDFHLGYFFKYFSMGTLLSVITLLAGFFIIFYTRKNEQNN